MRGELSGWRFYAALVGVVTIIGAGIWWRATGYGTDVGLAVAAAGIATLAAALIASGILSRRR